MRKFEKKKNTPRKPRQLDLVKMNHPMKEKKI